MPDHVNAVTLHKLQKYDYNETKFVLQMFNKLCKERRSQEIVVKMTSKRGVYQGDIGAESFGMG